MRSYISHRRAAAGSQYALVVGLIAVVALLAVAAAGSSLSQLLTSVANRLGAGNGSSSAAASGGGGAPPATDGRIFGWGNNGQYALTSAAGTPNAPTALTAYNGLGAFRIIQTDGNTSCAITNGNAFYCVGQNNNGQAQPGGPSNVSSPVNIGTSSAVQLANNNTATCQRNGTTISCFGDSASGCSKPFGATLTALSTGTADIKMGSFFGCAVLTSGAAICWGNGGNGMGPATGCNGSYNTMIASGAAKIGTGIVNHSCVLMSDGSMRCWGMNDYQQLGSTPVGSGPFTTAQTVPDISGASQVAAGAYHSCAITSGILRCFGRNSSGQLGDGTTTGRGTAAAVSGLTNVSYVGLGFQYSCALQSSGNVWCWGDNTSGQIGNGTSTGTVTLPYQVPGLSGVIQISVGQHTMLALAP